MLVYDTLAPNPCTIYSKENVKVQRCGEIISIFKGNNVIFRSYQPNKVNPNLIIKIVDKILQEK